MGTAVAMGDWILLRTCALPRADVGRVVWSYDEDGALAGAEVYRREPPATLLTYLERADATLLRGLLGQAGPDGGHALYLTPGVVTEAQAALIARWTAYFTAKGYENIAVHLDARERVVASYNVPTQVISSFDAGTEPPDVPAAT